MNALDTIEIEPPKPQIHSSTVWSIRWVLLSLHRLVTFSRNLVTKAIGGHAYYAEFCCDRVVRKNFFPDFSYKGVLVEVGCATPKLISFSQHFRETGWRCIGVEPNPEFVDLHKTAGNEVYQFAAADFESDNVPFTVVEDSKSYGDTSLSAHSFSALSIRDEFAGYRGGIVETFNQREIKVSVRKLDTVLAEALPPVVNVDVVSVDVEGYELDVMRGFTPEKFGVKVVVLENLFHRKDYTDYMNSVGFSLWKKVGYNYFFTPTAISQKQ